MSTLFLGRWAEWRTQRHRAEGSDMRGEGAKPQQHLCVLEVQPAGCSSLWEGCGSTSPRVMATILCGHPAAWWPFP